MQALALINLVKNLADLASVMLRLHFDDLRFSHKLRSEFGNTVWVGGRKQQSLSVLGTLAHQLCDVVKESHVEHAIGLVQNQSFDGLQLQGSTF